MWKQYNVTLFWFVLSLFAVIAVVNIISDPGKIYLQRYLERSHISDFADNLIKEEIGLPRYGNERLVKSALSRKAGFFDCAILGSSRIMQLSTKREPSSFDDICKSSINLGVSACSIEDILVYSHSILQLEKKPKKIIIGIDPWDLKFGMDSQYGIFREKFSSIMDELKEEYSERGESYQDKLLKNLVNLKYFTVSIGNLFDGDFKITGKDFENTHIKTVDYKRGNESKIILADGSTLYSKAEISDMLKKINPPSGGFKEKGEPYTDKGVRVLNKLIKLLKKEMTVIIFMSPYHENVFTKPGITVTNKKAAEKKLREIAKSNGIKIYGSYDPRKIGCKKNEFYDFMHPRRECLNRIRFK